jgi:hypothetical protein
MTPRSHTARAVLEFFKEIIRKQRALLVLMMEI